MRAAGLYTVVHEFHRRVSIHRVRSDWASSAVASQTSLDQAQAELFRQGGPRPYDATQYRNVHIRVGCRYLIVGREVMTPGRHDLLRWYDADDDWRESLKVESHDVASDWMVCPESLALPAGRRRGSGGIRIVVGSVPAPTRVADYGIPRSEMLHRRHRLPCYRAMPANRRIPLFRLS